MPGLGLALVAVVSVAGAKPDAVSRGRVLFNDPSMGKNGISCAGCHAIVEDEAAQGDGLIRAGHTLFGVAQRPHWRGDTRRTALPTLARAIDVCVQLFQGGSGLAPEQGRELEQYLATLSGKTRPGPLQIQPALEANLDYERDKYLGGDADRGRTAFYRACSSCHPRGGKGLGPALYGKSRTEIALRTREGNGLLRGSREAGAWMPFYGKDRLTDAEVADIAAFVVTLEPEKQEK